MGEFKTNSILVYVEPEAKHSSALQAAINFPGSENGTITLATAIDLWPPYLLPEDLIDAYVQDLVMALEALAHKYENRGRQIQTKVLKGRPNLEIVREVIRSGHDLLMKDLEGSTRDNEDALTGLDARLLRKCPCPIWLTRARGEESGIGVALAPESDREGIDFNTHLLQTAIDLGKKTSQTVHVIQAWEMMGQIFLARKVSPAEYERYMQTYEREVAETLAEFLKPFGITPGSDRVHLVHGSPERVIQSTVEELGLETLVIGTVARGGLSGHLLGNTAEQVVKRVNCSVLTIKPAGWKSPVQV